MENKIERQVYNDDKKNLKIRSIFESGEFLRMLLLLSCI